MKRVVALSVGALVALVLAGTATADRPQVEVENVAGDEIVCGETTLTATSGQFVSRTHVHQVGNDLYRVIFFGVTRHIRAEDEDGNTYRAVGTVQGNFLTENPDGEEIESGFFRVNIKIIGKGGLFGTVRTVERTNRQGETTSANRGTCEIVED